MSLLYRKISDCHQPIEGVVIERRQLLKISLGTVLALASGSLDRDSLAQQSGGASLPLSWDGMIQRVASLAEALVIGETLDEESYLAQLSVILGQQTAIPRAFFDLSEPVGQHISVRRFPLLVVQFRLAPGARIPYHDHRNYIGALTVTAGTIRIRSFEILGSDRRPPLGHTFQIRETGNDIHTEGSQSTLSRTRDNIHDLSAGSEGARLIDFFTLFRDDANSSYLNVSEEPSDSENRIFDASWA